MTTRIAFHDYQEEFDGNQVLSHWREMSRRLHQIYGDATFRSWFSELELAEFQDHRVILTVPTRFIREWVVSNYHETILALWKEVVPTVQIVDVFVRSDAESSRASAHIESAGDIPQASRPLMPKADASQNDNADWGASYAGAGIKIDSHNAKVLDFTLKHIEENISSPLDERFTFDRFVVGKSNQMAYAAARNIAQQSEAANGANPLFLHSGVGQGKTHLLHAVAWEMRKRNPQRNVVYLTAERFMFQFVRALRNNDALAFKEQFRSVDVLLVDDIQFISGKESTLEEFFHSFNSLIDNQRQIIISCDRCPSDLKGMGERARSRLGWGLVLDIHASDKELRMGILESKASALKTEIPSEVQHFLADKIISNTRELEGALNKIVAHSQIMQTPITLESTQHLLKDLLRFNERHVSVSDIIQVVSKHFKIKPEDLCSNRRVRSIARPRQLAMYLAKILTIKSLVEIGQSFGGKDHTTVMHAIKTVDKLLENDAEMATHFAEIRRKLQ